MKLDVIYNEDCLTGIKRLPDESVDMIITSPPYDNLRKYGGTGGWNFDVFKPIAKEISRVLKNGGVCVWVVSDGVVNGSETGSSFRQALYFKDECGLSLYDTMIWEKPSPQAPTEGRYYDVFEYMFVFCKGKKPKTLNLICDHKNKSAGHISKRETRSCAEDRKMTNKTRVVKEYSRRFNVWQISRDSKGTGHPAVFPLQLTTDHILSWSNEGDVVLDPFMGSGTTALACINNNRHYIGFELNEEYYKIAIDRIKSLA